MPIYEFKCNKCNQKFEQRLGFSYNKKSLKCPKCGAEDPDRVFSPIMTGASGVSSLGSASASSSCSSGGFS